MPFLKTSAKYQRLQIHSTCQSRDNIFLPTAVQAKTLLLVSTTVSSSIPHTLRKKGRSLFLCRNCQTSSAILEYFLSPIFSISLSKIFGVSSFDHLRTVNVRIFAATDFFGFIV